MRDRALWRVGLWFIALWSLLALALILAYWLNQRALIADRADHHWAEEEAGAQRPKRSGAANFAIALVRDVPRRRIDAGSLPTLDAPTADHAPLVKPTELALRPPAPSPPGKAEAPVSGTEDGKVDAVGDPPATKAADPGSGGGAGAGGAGAGKGGKGLTGQPVPASAIIDLLAGRTLIGTEGAFDGSEPVSDNDTRAKIPWQVYYAPDGSLIARWTMLYARIPHGPLELVTFTERGTWTLDGETLCQSIKRWGYGLPVCFNLRKDETKGETLVALYYTACGGLSRCYAGRLGPEGVMRPGKIGFD